MPVSAADKIGLLSSTNEHRRSSPAFHVCTTITLMYHESIYIKLQSCGIWNDYYLFILIKINRLTRLPFPIFNHHTQQAQKWNNWFKFMLLGAPLPAALWEWTVTCPFWCGFENVGFRSLYVPNSSNNHTNDAQKPLESPRIHAFSPIRKRESTPSEPSLYSVNQTLKLSSKSRFSHALQM